MTSTNPPDPATPEKPASVEAAPPAAPKKKTAARRRGCLPWLILALVIAGGVAIWQYPAFKARAELGAAYAARIGCSCRYVEGRTLKSCQSDFEPGMEIVSVADDPATKSITGNVPLLATRTARFAGRSGCLLDPAD